MQWRAGPGAGFTAAGVEPWLPIGVADVRNVESQRADPDSILSLTRELIALRSSTGLGTGAFRTLSRHPGVWSWRIGNLIVTANMTDEPRRARIGRQVLLSSDPARERGLRRGDDTMLAPWEALVLQRE
jgi:alpha-glucosidase